MTFEIGRAWRWLTMKDTSAELATAQLRELLRQSPMLHVFLATNVVAIAVSNYGLAPRYLTMDAPAALICCNLARLVYWLNARNRPRNRAGTHRLLRVTALISICFASAYVSWAIALSVYSGIVGQAQIAVYLVVTVIGLTVCMIHLPQAAVGIAVVTIVPYMAFYAVQGNLQFGAIAIDVLLVTLVMFRVMSTSFRSFRKLVLANEQAERLHGEVSLLAHTDMLTGLPNRRLFFSELEKHMDRRNGSHDQLVLGIIDLDRFKTANDTFGHMVGDELLEMVGARLKKVFGRGQLVARLGGDEFAFVLVTGTADAIRIGEEACRALAVPYKLGKITVHIGASCGVATAEQAMSSRMLYDNADYALYQGKVQGRGTVTLYSLDHQERVKSERAVELALQSADITRELDLHLQPIVDTRTNAVVAVEALARWNNPHLGYVRPDIFIPIAERAGLTHRMTLSLFEKALSYIGLLPTNVNLSFNLSALDLTSEATILALVAMVQRSSIRPSRLYLELTETAAMRDFATAEQSIRILRAIGINISLDDFGTGQSSLSYLHRLPIDKVKLDRSFLMEAGGKSGREMLGAVVALCHSMNMECVAEGVEDGDQLQFLREIGCDLYQGYHFARPMPITDLLIFLRKHPDQMKLAG